MRVSVENTKWHCLLAAIALACGCHAPSAHAPLKATKCVCAPHGPCAGFFSTCWRQWPSQCMMCPPAIEPDAPPLGSPPLPTPPGAPMEMVPPPEPLRPDAPPTPPVMEPETSFRPSAPKEGGLWNTLQLATRSKPAVKPLLKTAPQDAGGRAKAGESQVSFTDGGGIFRRNSLNLRKPPLPISKSNQPLKFSYPSTE